MQLCAVLRQRRRKTYFDIIVGLTDFSPDACDIAIVGAGAAGLATAIFTRRLNPSRQVLLLDGAKKPGAKILVLTTDLLLEETEEVELNGRLSRRRA